MTKNVHFIFSLFFFFFTKSGPHFNEVLFFLFSDAFLSLDHSKTGEDQGYVTDDEKATPTDRLTYIHTHSLTQDFHTDLNTVQDTYAVIRRQQRGSGRPYEGRPMHWGNETTAYFCLQQFKHTHTLPFINSHLGSHSLTKENLSTLKTDMGAHSDTLLIPE